VSNTLAPAPASSAAAAPVAGDPSLSPPGGDPPEPAAPAPGADDPPAPAAGDQPPDADTPAARRIKELVDERNATRDYAEYWRQQATKGLQPPAPAATPPAAPVAKPAPTLAQFKNEDGTYNAAAWSEANAKWLDEQVEIRATAIVDQRLTVREQRQQQDQTASSWQQKCAEFRATQPDFDAVTSNPTLPIPKSVADVIVTLEKGPAVFHHLGTNPAEAARIARLTPAQQAVALGRLEERLVAAPKAPAAPRQQSRAPAPPNRTPGGGGGDINLETCSLDDYLAHRMPGRKAR
jgi:hypothetical protein